MAKTIAFTNQKGGVGKTTSAINIASALGILGKKTLLIDSDPQGNASSGVGVRKSQLSHTTYDVLIGRCPARDAVIRTEFKNLDVMPATMSLAGAEFELADIEKRERRLSAALDEIKSDYDFIIIDCPPSLGMLTINALVASDGTILPMQCEYFSLANDDDDKAGQKALQSQSCAHRNTSHDVQRQTQSFNAGRRRTEKILRIKVI